MQNSTGRYIAGAVVLASAVVEGYLVHTVALPFLERLLVFNTSILGPPGPAPAGFGYMYSVPTWFTVVKYVLTASSVVLVLLIGRSQIRQRYGGG
ncbi:MAG: hypothetical protein SVW77_04045 [Candidatus Nanohaloarchaea archaeon]|nr:hypothetical protein [Candidatus Nanohaloarchaea archaeon]